MQVRPVDITDDKFGIFIMIGIKICFVLHVDIKVHIGKLFTQCECALLCCDLNC